MLKLTRRTEYALLALRFMSSPGQKVSSVHAVAQHYGIPEPLLAKVLQRLKRGGLASATKGASGGYALVRQLEEVPMLEVLDLFDESTSLVSCIGEDDCDCQLQPACEIRDGMKALNDLMTLQLRGLSVAQFFRGVPQGQQLTHT